MKTGTSAVDVAKCALPLAFMSSLTEFINDRYQRLMGSALAAIAALVFIGIFTPYAHAQGAVAPTCPAGYMLKGGQCLPASPAPSCPSGYVFSGTRCVPSAPAAPAPTCPSGSTYSGGRCVTAGVAPPTTAVATPTGGWVFITTKVLGVKSALELDGAVVCSVTGSPSEPAVSRYFQANGMKFSPMSLGAIDVNAAYERGICDVLTVQSHLASSTLGRLKRPGDHHILPEKIGISTAATPAPAAPCPYGTVRSGANCVPGGPQAAPRPPAPPAAALFPRELQANLWGMNCLTGNVKVVVDGEWGQRSREALRKFYQLARISFRNLEPTQAALNAMNSYSGAGSCSAAAAPRASGSCQSKFNTCMKNAGRIKHPRENFEMEQDCKKQFSACSGQRSPQRPATVTKKARCSKIKFAFTRGNTCACSGGRIFTGSACVKPQQQKPRQSQAQCVKSCDAIGNQCNRKLTQLGDAKGWDGDLRQDYWDDNCAPKVNSCKVACNPKGPMRPGECRFMADGEQVCS